MEQKQLEELARQARHITLFGHITNLAGQHADSQADNAVLRVQLQEVQGAVAILTKKLDDTIAALGVVMADRDALRAELDVLKVTPAAPALGVLSRREDKFEDEWPVARSRAA